MRAGLHGALHLLVDAACVSAVWRTGDTDAAPGIGGVGRRRWSGQLYARPDHCCSLP